MLEKRWVHTPVDEQQVSDLQQSLGINPTMCRLLVQRGITTYDEAKHFFRPSLEHLHNPYLMEDMEQAVERIEKAIAASERILVYGDYDVDGTTSVALVYSFLQDFYDKLGYYIPDRYKEGYGISRQSIDFAKEEGYTLIIALDCGIKSLELVDYAKGLGIDYIICDHHLPGDTIPNAIAVLDPKRSDCDYPYKELSGCGIGFKLIQAFAERNHIPDAEIYKQLDLVATSIAADIVPITGENRVLMYFGLQKMNADPRPGLASILELGGLEKKELSVSDIVFVISPRINAAGRMDKGVRAVELLVPVNGEKQDIRAGGLNGHNVERKKVDTEITQEALAMIAQEDTLINRKTTVLCQPHWHKGVIGIVASRLTETYYRPTIVLTENEGKLTGSARSVKGFNIYSAIQQCEDLLEQFGGHEFAAGLTLSKDNLEQFSQRFEEVVSGSIAEELLTPEIEVSAELRLSEVNDKFYKLLKQFAPFGPGNRRPVFLSKGVKDKGGSRVVGDKHLRLVVTQEGDKGYAGIGFGLGEHLRTIQRKGGKSQSFDICYTLEENEWNGYVNLQLNVKDIKIEG